MFTVVIEQRERQSSKVGLRSVIHMVDAAGKWRYLYLVQTIDNHVSVMTRKQGLILIVMSFKYLH